MPGLRTLTALMASTAIVAALPATDSLEKRAAFRLDQQLKGSKLKAGPREMQRTFEKYGKSVPDNVRQAAAAASTGSATATPEDSYDSLYLTPVNVGGTTLMLDFDTGSADLWCFSNQLPSSETSGHALYYPGSTSKKLSGYSWDITYGDGSGASGNVYADRVVVGDVTATSQAVEAATSVSSQFSQDTDNDGLLGLAFSSINTVQPETQTTFFDTVKATLAKPLFAVDLQYHAAGSYDFGFIDSSKYTGGITYVNVDSSNGFWEFTTTGYSIGSGPNVSSSIDSIADTGTTLLYLPTSVVKAYYQSVQGAGYSNSQAGYVFPCSATLPDFSLVIGGTKFTVPGKYINYAPVTSTSCYGGIQDNTGIGFSILGDIFLKAMYVVFENSGSPRFGIAQQASV